MATNEVNIKNVIPPFLILILFQDTIQNLLGPAGVFLTYLDEMFVFICIPALIINFLRGKKIFGGLIFLAIVGVLFFGTMSSINNNNPFNISLQGMQLMIKGLLYLFVFSNISFSNSDLLKYVKWVKYAALGVLFFSLVDLAAPSAFRSLIGIKTSVDYRLGIASLQSLFIHPGIYGWFMAFIGVYLAVNYKVQSDFRYFYFACIFFFFAVLSFRFKTIIAILVIISIFYLISGIKNVLTLIIPVTIISVVIFLLAGNYLVELTDLTVSRYVEVDVMKSARKAMYHFAFVIANTNFPFGVGFGRYGGFIAREEYSPVYYEYGMNNIYGLSPENPIWATDTYWPYILGELGYCGTIILLVLFAYLLIKLFSNYKNIGNKIAKSFVLFAAFVLIQALVESFGEPVFNSSPQSVFIFVTTGIGFSLICSQNKLLDSSNLKIVYQSDIVQKKITER
ncbi:hypothetical protein H9647_22365 [Paenibacillus sp. Sa2BVA9]|uniref:Uncharacterized protein n=1 Tax=Paenibacillus gallinarum TaxID=2762232 RepID=A0ABR8T502_9BACL|nr:hypothetical protein [Paenibacillus gallinarum]